MHRQKLLGHAPPIKSPNRSLQIPITGSMQNLFVIVHQTKAYIRTGQGQLGQKLTNIASLGNHGLQELAPGRHIEEKVFHNDGGAGTATSAGNLHIFAALNVYRGCQILIRRTGQQGKIGHGSNAGQCLTAKAQCLQGH